MGTLTRGGQEYRGVMPAWRNALNDGQIAAVLTYIRQSWGNNAPPISSLDVLKARNDTFTRNSFWTPQELEGVKDETKDAEEK